MSTVIRNINISQIQVCIHELNRSYILPILTVRRDTHAIALVNVHVGLCGETLAGHNQYIHVVTMRILIQNVVYVCVFRAVSALLLFSRRSGCGCRYGHSRRHAKRQQTCKYFSLHDCFLLVK